MKNFRNFRIHNLVSLLIAASVSLVGCSDDDDSNDVPPVEEEVEVITDVTLVFTNIADSTDVVTATAQDPDGEGALELVIEDEITLSTSTMYTLTFEIENSLADDEDEANIGAEILEENDEHQFFFSFSENAFTTPTGDGNIDNASDPINYEDEDDNGNPVGLETAWVTPATALSGGNFTVRLQHQPEIKTATTGAEDGDTDFDLTFVLNVVE